MDHSERVYAEPSITSASQDVVASAHTYTALGPLKGTSESEVYMSSPSDKDSTLLSTQGPVGVPKNTQGKKAILAFVLLFLIVSVVALILGIISLTKLALAQSSDLARLDGLNAGLSSLNADLNAKLDSLNARVDTMSASLRSPRMEGCYSESLNCSLALHYNNLTSHCSTGSLHINVTVSSVEPSHYMQLWGRREGGRGGGFM